MIIEPSTTAIKRGDKVSKSEWATTKKWLQYENIGKTVKTDDIGNSYYGLDDLAGRFQHMFQVRRIGNLN
jgi:hypothetical protein